MRLSQMFLHVGTEYLKKNRNNIQYLFVCLFLVFVFGFCFCFVLFFCHVHSFGFLSFNVQ